MQSTTQRSVFSVSSILLLIGILILFNAVVRRALRDASVDLTSEGEYTLSQGTENILDSLHAPLTIKYYYSKSAGARYPIVRLWGERIKDLLNEYQRLSKGQISLEIYDPRPDTEEEEWAQRYGLSAIPTRDNESIYIGLVGVNANGDEQTIPVFDLQRQQYLEYDISRLVSILSKEKKTVIGVLSPLKLFGTPGNQEQRIPPSDPWIIVNQLKEFSDVREIPTTVEEIPSEVEVLLVAHPRGFAKNQWYAIDQFVMRGGRLILLTDPWCSLDTPEANAQDPMASLTTSRASVSNEVLEKWGVTQHEGVVADLAYSASVASGRGEPPKNHPLWIVVPGAAMNSTDVVTTSLDSVLLPWVASFDVKPLEGVVYETMLESSEQTQIVGENDYKFGGGDLDSIMRRFTPEDKRRVLALRIKGKLPSAYPEGRAADAAPVTMPHLNESKGSANVIVIGDADFIADRYSAAVQDVFGAKIVTPINDNLNLVLNSVENLSGSDDLISVRSRGRFTRPFVEVQRLEAEAQQKFRAEEMRLQAELNGANQRLQQLQAGAGKGEGASQLYDSALMQEIKKFRDQKASVQRNLRTVRHDLRQGIERLGQILFLINTFAVPIFLILVYTWYHERKRASH